MGRGRLGGFWLVRCASEAVCRNSPRALVWPDIGLLIDELLSSDSCGANYDGVFDRKGCEECRGGRLNC
jgi:hypothetical protein